MENLGFSASLDLSQFNSKIDQMEANIKEIGRAANSSGQSIDSITGKTKGLGSSLSGLGSVIGFAALAAGAKQLVGNIIQVRSEFEKYEAVLTTSLGSQTLAKAAMGDLVEFASKTPFALTELTGAYVKLTNYGLKPSMEEMKKYGDLAASVGKGFDQLAEAAADAVTGEFERLKEFGIKAKKEGDKITFTFKEQKTVVDNNAESIKNYLTGLGEMQGVAGSMAGISETLGGRISNLGDNWDKLMNTLGGESTGVFATVITSLSKMIEMIDMASKSTKTLREEALNKSIKDSTEPIKAEVATIAVNLKKNGMSDEAANKRALELYTKQIEGSIIEAQEKVDKLIDKSNKGGKKFIFGADYKKQVADIKAAQDELALLKGEKELLPSVFAKPKTPDKPTVKDADKQAVKGTINYLEEELKKLKAKTGTFLEPAAEAKNADLIKLKLAEIEAAYLKVRKAGEGTLGISLTNENGKNAPMKRDETIKPIEKTTKALNMQLVPMKKLTAEEEKQLEIERKKAEAETKINIIKEIEAENMAAIGDNLIDAADLGNELGGVVGKLNDGLGEGIQKMSDIVGNAGNLAVKLGEAAISGDYLGAAIAGIQFLGSLINASDQTAIDRQNEALERTNKLIETQNKLMQMQSGEDWWKSATNEISRLNKEIETAKTNMSNWAMFNSGLDIFTIVGMTPQDWLDYFKESGRVISDAQITWLNNWIDAEKAVFDLQDNVLGFTNDEVSDGIVSGIMDGLKLAENGLGDFADTFKNLLKKAMLQALTTKIDTKKIETFTKSVTDAMAVDGVSQQELSDLQIQYQAIVKDLDEKSKIYLNILGETAEGAKAEGLKGSIKGITEQTAGALEGNFNAMLFNIAGVKEVSIDMRGIMVSQLESLRTIAGNTSYNWHLVDMAQDITLLKKAQISTNTILQSIKDNQATGFTL